jgi:hypothetical protein
MIINSNKPVTTVHSARFTYVETKAMYKLLEYTRNKQGCRSLRLSDLIRNCILKECKKNKLLNDSEL